MNKSCRACGGEFSPNSSNQEYCMPCKINHKAVYRVTSDSKERYDRVRRGAKIRQIAFELTYEEFAEYYGSHCVYCGDLTGTVNLDRINSSIGYTVNNVVPCCPDCNRMKGTKSVDEFYLKLKKMLECFEC